MTPETKKQIRDAAEKVRAGYDEKGFSALDPEQLHALVALGDLAEAIIELAA